MTYLEKAQQFQSTIQEKGALKAFETFYAEDCTVTEIPTGVIRQGKQEQREAIQEWQSNVQTFHAAGIKNITSNEETAVTMIESWFDITFQNGHRRKLEEVGIQKWKGTKIIDEKFYYNIPG